MARAAIALVAALLLSMNWERFGDDLAGTFVWHSFGATVTAIIWFGALRQTPGRRIPWLVLAGALTAWTVSDVVWEILAWDARLPDVSLVDVFYLAGYLGFFVALLLFIRQATGHLPADALIDGLVAAFGVGLVVWASLVEPAGHQGSLTFRLVTLAYPLAALLLLAALAWMRFHPRRAELPPGTGLLAVAISLLIVLEVVSAWADLNNQDARLEDPLDRGFHVTFGLMALASLRRVGGRHRPDTRADHPLRFVVLGAALLSGPTMVAIADSTQAWVASFMAGIAALVLGRFALLHRSWERAKAELAHAADHDALTGLANRNTLARSLDDAVERSGAGDAQLALLYIDVDHFKTINDEHGHAAGDIVLVELAERLRRVLRPGDLAVRLGGDEFVVLCERVRSIDDAVGVADRLRTLTGQPVTLRSGVALDVSLSIGITTTSSPAPTLDRLLREADASLYAVKRRGRDGVAVGDELIRSVGRT